MVAVTALAYHHSLRALLESVGDDTPLAYLGLVPLLALGVAVVKGRPRPGEGRLPHRQADWIIGLPLLAVAAVVATVLPGRLSYDFWTGRIDMLGLPFFVAGMVALLLGSRVLHRVRLPVAALVLAWPLPYELVLERVLGAASAFTLAAVRWAVPLLGVGREAGGTVFDVGEGAARFSVNVAPECAGASSALGFLLVGGAVTMALPGRRRAKAAWLGTGLAVQLLLNVLRILAVFAAGDAYGERVAVDWLHPYIGLVLFTVSMSVLVAVLPRFGIRRAAARPGPEAPPRGRPPHLAAVAAAVACAVVFGAANAGLRRFDPFLGIGGAAPYRPVAAGASGVAGWTDVRHRTVDWAKPYFGASSTWDRRTYASDARTVYVDAVQSDDLRSFSRYGLKACYRFHSYDVIASATADVGAPGPAQTLAYRDSTGRAWSAVSWVWPVAAPGRPRFERVVVIAAVDGADERRARDDVVAFARSVVRAHGPRQA